MCGEKGINDKGEIIKPLLEDLSGDLTYRSLEKNCIKEYPIMGYCDPGYFVVHYVYITKNNIVVISDVHKNSPLEIEGVVENYSIVKLLDRENLEIDGKGEDNLYSMFWRQDETAGDSYGACLYSGSFEEFFEDY